MIGGGGGHVCDERERAREREKEARERGEVRERKRAREKSIATHRYSHTSFTHPPQTSQLKCRLHNSRTQVHVTSRSFFGRFARPASSYYHFLMHDVLK